MYNKGLIDRTRYVFLIICSCDHLKHYNSQGSVDVSILPEVSKGAKLKVFPEFGSLWSNKGIGTPVTLFYIDQVVS
jgi:hypothetical protein